MANEPTNRRLYNRVVAEARRKFRIFPSAYASAFIVREYKKEVASILVEKVHQEA